MADQVATVETPADFDETPAGIVRRWLAEIDAYNRHFKRWRTRCEKVVRRYRDESLDVTIEDDGKFETKNFNIFWSNVETLKPALLAQAPKVVVRRRNRDRDSTALAASQIMQRGVQYLSEHCDYESRFKAARDDYLLTARGTDWVRYEPTYGEEQKADLTVTQGTDGSYLDEAGTALATELVPQVVAAEDGSMTVPKGGAPYKPVIEEKVYIDHVTWSEFGHTPAPSWDLVTAVWRRVDMTREQLRDRFGKEVADQVALTRQLAGLSTDTAKEFGDVFKRGEVYEIWDKSSRRVYWISPGYKDKPLDQKPDPLRLRDFFPCPKPLYGTTTTDTLVPVPDYLEYQAQAVQLDILTQRIDVLASTLRVAGAYDSAFPLLENIIKGKENTLIPVDNWAMFAEKGGIAGAISFLPVKEVAEVLVRLMAVRNQVKQDLYEVSGLSDIVRGQSEPSATATAERIKGQFVSLRLQDRQRHTANFLRDSLALVGEILAEHFSDESLLEISGWLQTANAIALGDRALEVAKAAIKLLRDDRLRTFKIGVETESTIFEDVEFEKKSRVEFMTATSQFLQQALPAAERYPEIKPLLGQMLMYGVRGFYKGVEIEEVFERAIEDMALQQGQAQQRDTTAQVELGQLQVKMQQLQANVAKNTAEFQLKQQQQQWEQGIKTQQFLADQERHMRDYELAKQELEIKMQELSLAVAELGLKREELSQRERLENNRLAVDSENRTEDRAAELADADRERELTVNDKQGDRMHEMELRRLEGKPVPGAGEDGVAPDILSVLSDVVKQQTAVGGQLVKLQTIIGEQLVNMTKVMAAPRVLVRDPKTNRPERAEVDLSAVIPVGEA